MDISQIEWKRLIWCTWRWHFCAFLDGAFSPQRWPNRRDSSAKLPTSPQLWLLCGQNEIEFWILGRKIGNVNIKVRNPFSDGICWKYLSFRDMIKWFNCSNPMNYLYWYLQLCAIVLQMRHIWLHSFIHSIIPWVSRWYSHLWGIKRENCEVWSELSRHRSHQGVPRPQYAKGRAALDAKIVVFLILKTLLIGLKKDFGWGQHWFVRGHRGHQDVEGQRLKGKDTEAKRVLSWRNPWSSDSGGWRRWQDQEC